MQTRDSDNYDEDAPNDGAFSQSDEQDYIDVDNARRAREL